MRALKLVGESFPFTTGSRCLLTADNHNSVNGIREFARSRDATVTYLPLRPADLRPDDADVLAALDRAPDGRRHLFAFPAQSNYSGVRHPLEWTNLAQARGWDVLLDASAYVPTNELDLSRWHPDFVAISWYKVFGYPTGIGSLVARREALARLRRPWFAGGTIGVASVVVPRHTLGDGEIGFEDGTIDYLGLPAIEIGLRHVRSVGVATIHRRVEVLTRWLLGRLSALRHPDGAPVVRLYGPTDTVDRGGTIPFNVLDRAGHVVDFWKVEAAAADRRISLRTGCFCNPGASETARGITAHEMEGVFALGRQPGVRGSADPSARSSAGGGARLGRDRDDRGRRQPVRRVPRGIRGELRLTGTARLAGNCSSMRTSGTRTSIPPRPVRMTPSARRSRSTRTTTSRTDPTASASACWLTGATSRSLCGCSEARSRMCRATRCRTVEKALPGISATKSTTRSLSSSMTLRATRMSPLGEADHDVSPEGDEIRVHHRLQRRGEGVVRREEGHDARELARAEVADRQAPTIGSPNEDAEETVDQQLEVRAGFAELADGRARERVDRRGAFEERGGDVRGQIAEMRVRKGLRDRWIVEHGASPGHHPATVAAAASRSAPIITPRRHSSVVEQLFRKQQVLGSSPSVGSTLPGLLDHLAAPTRQPSKIASQAAASAG